MIGLFSVLNYENYNWSWKKASVWKQTKQLTITKFLNIFMVHSNNKITSLENCLQKTYRPKMMLMTIKNKGYIIAHIML